MKKSAVAAARRSVSPLTRTGSSRSVMPAAPKLAVRQAVVKTVPPLPGGKGKKVGKTKYNAAAVAANKIFLHSVIPTRIERLEILRQLYDKRREAPQKPGTAERPNEEEESEGEFVVSDEIVSSDSSEP